MAKKRYSKLEREILEILEEKDREPKIRRFTRRPRSPFGFKRPTPSGPGRFLDRGNWVWLGGTIALALAAVIVADWSRFVAAILAIVCILFFLSPIVLSRGAKPPTRSVYQWRGKDIELPPSRSNFLGELRYRIWQIRNRR